MCSSGVGDFSKFPVPSSQSNEIDDLSVVIEDWYWDLRVKMPSTELIALSRPVAIIAFNLPRSDQTNRDKRIEGTVSLSLRSGVGKKCGVKNVASFASHFSPRIFHLSIRGCSRAIFLGASYWPSGSWRSRLSLARAVSRSGQNPVGVSVILESSTQGRRAERNAAVKFLACACPGTSRK